MSGFCGLDSDLDDMKATLRCVVPVLLVLAVSLVAAFVLVPL